MSQRRILVICDGNTCRSPTLMLLLRYRSRQLGITTGFLIESCGVTPEAATRRPMLDVAKDAAAVAAGWLEQQGPSNLEAHARLSLLREEAEQHFSQDVDDALAKEARYANVVCLITKKGKKRLMDNPTAVRILQMAQVLHCCPVSDTAFYTYKRYHQNERHTKVIQAYRKQAYVLAELVLGKLRNLFAHTR
jgi:low molecular weight phosphotyrosine protein phosphatase